MPGPPPARGTCRAGRGTVRDRTGPTPPPRQLRPPWVSHHDFPVDPGGLAASVPLRHLPHAEQRVAPASQHQLLQIADPFQVPVPRRLEDPLPQPPYVVLVGRPVNGLPV